MNDPRNFEIDPDGLPVLNELVSSQELQSAENNDRRLNRMSVADIANELLDNEVFKRQLDDIAREMSGGIRLQMEQALGIALETVITDALERNKLRSFELIRRHLENVLPGMLAKILEDQGLSG
jgi:hypothetical protein